MRPDVVAGRFALCDPLARGATGPLVAGGSLLAAYRISQARLAGALGLSPPMLSQLMSGQRAKISNPAVFGRLVRLEELAARVTDAAPPWRRSGCPARPCTPASWSPRPRTRRPARGCWPGWSRRTCCVGRPAR